MKTKNIMKALFATGVLYTVMIVGASALDVANNSIISRFTSYADLGTFEIKTPKVVEVLLPPDVSTYKKILVTSSGTEVFEPSLVKRAANATMVSANVTAILGGLQEDVSALNDNNYQTFKQFNLPETGNGSVELTFSYQAPITATAFSFALDANVALPRTITLYTEDEGKEVIVLSTVTPNQTTVLFPKTTAKTWKVVFTYAQPLRITEAYFNQETKVNEQVSLRFLALPNVSYRMYVNPDQEPAISFKKEAGDLYSDQGILKAKAIPVLIPNALFKDIDSDGDGVIDIRDNCVSVKNEDQKDADGNGRGDACDDYDRDGVINSLDNCVDAPNRDQIDTDHDGVGDLCDGQESRFLEANAWVPWVALGLVGFVIVGLMTNMVVGTMKKKEEQ